MTDTARYIVGFYWGANLPRGWGGGWDDALNPELVLALLSSPDCVWKFPESRVRRPSLWRDADGVSPALS